MINKGPCPITFSFLKILFRLVYHAFALLGIASVAFGLVYAKKLMNDHSLTPRQFVVKVAEKSGINSEMVQSAVAPNDKFDGYRFTGEMKHTYPRILFKDQSMIDKIRNRYETDPKFAKQTDSLTSGASAWLCAKDYAEGEMAIKSILNTSLVTPKAQGQYGNGLSFALKYDMLANHPEWTEEKRQRIMLMLRKNLKEAFLVLNGKSASMWHGRFELACSTWAVASTLDIRNPADYELLEKAQAHFLEAVKAIEMTEGWPEGYNYWINNRAYPFLLACLSHMNSVQDRDLNARIRKIVKKVGLWTIYGTRPDGMFHLFADTGPRNDLKDETQRVIDLIFLATENPVFKQFSEYIDGRHGREGYYRKYRWGLPVFRGLDDPNQTTRKKREDLSFAENQLPPSRIFGKDYFGQAFIRSGWQNDDTFISYRAGDTFTHHGHYKAGHFTLFKNAPLAISSGVYTGFTTEHRLNYYIRTVSSNSILIMSPDECQQPNKFFKNCVSAGGQRIILPTGSAVTGTRDFKENHIKGKKYQGGDILVFDNTHPAYVYMKSDLTESYSRNKAESVMRELVYLKKQDLLLVHDIVESTRKQYTKKWLLHTWTKPATNHEKVLKGTASNGILETTDKTALVTYNTGKLHVETLLPEKSLMRKIGGSDFRYYVEADGDDSDLDGKNMKTGANDKPWFDAGMWRIEIQPEQPVRKTEFLVILKPFRSGSQPNLDYEKTLTDESTEIRCNGTSVSFSKSGKKAIVREK